MSRSAARGRLVSRLRAGSCAVVLPVLLATSSGCYGRGAGLFGAVVATAIVTSAIVSATSPPPPAVVYVPDPRPGYVWQQGYWTLQQGSWVWVPGQWIVVQPGYVWSPTHWEQQPDGSWRLAPGQWVVAQ